MSIVDKYGANFVNQWKLLWTGGSGEPTKLLALKVKCTPYAYPPTVDSDRVVSQSQWSGPYKKCAHPPSTNTRVYYFMIEMDSENWSKQKLKCAGDVSY